MHFGKIALVTSLVLRTSHSFSPIHGSNILQNRNIRQRAYSSLEMASISYYTDASTTASFKDTNVIFIGRKSTLKSLDNPESFLHDDKCDIQGSPTLAYMMKDLSGGPNGGKTQSYVPIPVVNTDPATATDAAATEDEHSFIKTTLISLPDKVTRNNHYMSPHLISDLLAQSCPKKGNVAVYVAGLKSINDAGSVAAAIGRSFPLYNSKSSANGNNSDSNSDDEKSGDELSIKVCFLDESCQAFELDDDEKTAVSQGAKAASDGVMLAACLGDMPPAELTTDAYSLVCQRIANELGDRVTFQEIVGNRLDELNYGGLYGVGKAAECPPRLIVMTYTPEHCDENTESVALVGKGIVYDTGGLSLKSKAGMPGMKRDMGGSAGLLGGFQAAVQMKVNTKLTLVLGIAENAIGNGAVRNDDILKMYSGKTVEINNTDAEGRLVLGDCVAHVTKNIGGVDLIMDMATLTGAQLICTGKKHAGILANTEELEKRVFDAGMRSGDLTYPMLYAPELLQQEFASKVADMKNSVKDRGNAQSSCAGHFIESHLDPSFKGGWVHVDMAGPDNKNERSRGYGVALVLGLLGTPGFSMN